MYLYIYITKAQTGEPCKCIFEPSKPGGVTGGEKPGMPVMGPAKAGGAPSAALWLLTRTYKSTYVCLGAHGFKKGGARPPGVKKFPSSAGKSFGGENISTYAYIYIYVYICIYIIHK